MIRIKNPTPARLPSEYQEVEYIEDSGSQYINTGVPNSSAIKVVTEEQFNGSVDALSGIDYTVVSYYRFKWGTNSNGYLYYGYGTNNYASTTTPDTTKWYRFTMGYGNQKIEDVATGTVIKSSTATMSEYHSTYGIHLFAVMNAYYNRIDNATGGNKIRSCKIYDSDTLVRDFVPCYRKSDNVAGLYDLVNNVFYTNAGSGTFLMGNEVGKRDINIKPVIEDTPLLRRYVQDKLVYGEEPKQGRFVTVGTSGNSYYSIDGETWASMSGLESLSTSSNRGVTYGNGIFVTINSAKKTYCSTDGLTWVKTNGVATNTIYSVTYGNGRFVAVGISGTSYYSTDGINWTAMSGLKSNYAYYGVTYGNGMFVAVGEAGGYIYYSIDGESWTYATTYDNTNDLYGVVYGNGVFVAVGTSGRTYYSTDGKTWTKKAISNTATFRSVTYGNGRFVCVGASGRSYYSTDGKTWVEMTGLASATYYGVTYGNGMFVAVGASGESHYSTDGETWVAMTGLASATYYGVAFGKV